MSLERVVSLEVFWSYWRKRKEQGAQIDFDSRATLVSLTLWWLLGSPIKGIRSPSYIYGQLTGPQGPIFITDENGNTTRRTCETQCRLKAKGLVEGCTPVGKNL